MTHHDHQLDALSLDVRDLMGRAVANLYSHLVTRPTGRAVRLAIETQLADVGRPVLSVVDFSSVAVLDYSCADEVVAKLLLALREPAAATGPASGYVLFRGIQEFHRDPIDAVLERHDLRAVALLEGRDDRAELLGPADPEVLRVWSRLEGEGRVAADRVSALLDTPADAHRIEALVAARMIYRHPFRGDLLSLSTLSGELARQAP